MNDILTVDEIAKFLKCERNTVARKIRAGELKSKNIGTSKKPMYRIKKEWLEEYLVS